MVDKVRIYNNLTRKKEIFRPIDQGKVRFYSCGPTTYDFLHVGNARALVVADMFHRTFNVMGYDVNFVRNFTDVDDKIIKMAAENGRDPIEHAQIFVDECLKDMNSLGMLPATSTPKVSETMDAIIQMIKDLIEKEAAYEVEGEVFYRVESFKKYGKLSKKKLKDLEHGKRVEVDKRKEHPADFVLWKPAKEGEPSWDSPWGAGRPGWHIECSAMAKEYLGESIDLHHGGVDLMFPHHENEIAQSEAANGCKFCNFWAHNEFLNFGSDKMSKSLGNVITIRDFINTYGGQVLRQVLLSVHYRAKMEWSEDVIERGINDVERIHSFDLELTDYLNKPRSKGGDSVLEEKLEQFVTDMKKELANDFNSAGAFAQYFQFIRFCRRLLFKDTLILERVCEKLEEVRDFANESLGATHSDPQSVLDKIQSFRQSQQESSLDAEAIEALVKERVEAKSSKNWTRADEIRDELKAAGIDLKDNPDGTITWKYV